MTTTEQRVIQVAQPVQIRQLTLAGILGTWAAAALPMAVLAWLVGPWLAHGFDGPTALPRALILAMTAGLVWQSLLVLVLVYREQRSLRWSVLKDALWLHAPRPTKTGRRGGRAWLVVVPLVLALGPKSCCRPCPLPATVTWACSWARTRDSRSLQGTGAGLPSSSR